MVTMLLLTLALLTWSERALGGTLLYAAGVGKMPGFCAVCSSARKCLELQERVGTASCLRVLPPPRGAQKEQGTKSAFDAPHRR